MKSKYLYFFVLFFLSIMIIENVEGVACSGAPVANCTVTGVYQMPPGTYAVNVSGAITQGLKIAGNNAVIDCNGSTIYGNDSSATTYLVYSQGYSNVTIKNCNIIRGYNRAIFIQGTNVNVSNNNISNVPTCLYTQILIGAQNYITNNIINNCTTQAVNQYMNSNTTIAYNTISNSAQHLSFQQGTANTVTNNNFIAGTAVLLGIDVNNETYMSFRNNIINNVTMNLRLDANLNNISNNNFTNYIRGTSVTFLTLASNAHDNIIENNTVYDSFGWIFGTNNANNIIRYNSARNITGFGPINLQTNTTGIQIYGNSVNVSSQCMMLQYNSNFLIENNTCTNLYTNYDSWSSGILVQYNTTNGRIAGNRITNYCKWGIQLQQATNVTVTETNYMNPFTPEEQLNYVCNGYIGTFPTGIEVGETLMTYLGNNYEQWNDNITRVHTFACYNISINVTSSSFGNGVMLYLHTQGMYNSTVTGLTAYDSGTNWYRKIQPASQFVDEDEYFINNNYDYLYYKNTNYTGANSLGYSFVYPGLSNISYQGLDVNFYDVVERAQVQISKIRINIIAGANRSSINNASRNMWTQFPTNNMTIFSASSYYPYNDVKNSSNNVILSSNVNNFGLTLTPNQQIEVGDFGDCLVDSIFPCTIISSPPYDYATTKQCQSVRSASITALSEFPQWITLALMLIAVGVIITIIVSNMKDSRDSGMDSSFDLNNLFVVIIPVILTAIFIVLGIVILSNLC